MKTEKKKEISKEVTIFCKAHDIFDKRNALLAAKYVTMSKTFNDYQKRVLEKIKGEKR